MPVNPLLLVGPPSPSGQPAACHGQPPCPLPCFAWTAADGSTWRGGQANGQSWAPSPRKSGHGHVTGSGTRIRWGEPGVAQAETPPLSRPRMDLCGVWCCKSMEAEAALHANKDASNRSGKCQRPASGVAGGDEVHGRGEHSRQLGSRQADSYTFSCSWGKNQRP
jgi:hypothetical protein